MGEQDTAGTHLEEGRPIRVGPFCFASCGEIREAAAVVRRDRGVGGGWRFASIGLREPVKADLPDLKSGRLTRREVLVVSWNRADGQAYRAYRLADPRRGNQLAAPARAAAEHDRG